MRKKSEVFLIVNILRKAGRMVKRGAVYHHYKDRTQLYRVERLAYNTENEKVMVVYSSYANDDQEITWVRSLDSWLELVDGKEPRFQRIE